jgi:hypothetical protein
LPEGYFCLPLRSLHSLENQLATQVLASCGYRELGIYGDVAQVSGPREPIRTVFLYNLHFNRFRSCSYRRAVASRS